MKKKWISVKCGLSRDPKHRQAMGECVWLFLHMLDLADWESGIVFDWRDEEAAEVMDMPITTLRYQRRKLDELGYITCRQTKHSQSITIHNWTNPREYTGEVYNRRQGDNKQSPSEEFKGDNKGDSQVVTLKSNGDNKGDNNVSSQIVTPTSSSNIKESLRQKTKLPQNSDIGFMLAAGLSSEEIASQNATLEQDEAKLSAYELAMGYNPLNWYGDSKLERLRKFLVSKTEEEICAFAKWSRRQFTTFGPEKARMYPNQVIDFWPLSQPQDEIPSAPVPVQPYENEFTRNVDRYDAMTPEEREAYEAKRVAARNKYFPQKAS